jgi:hypothetical protein
MTTDEDKESDPRSPPPGVRAVEDLAAATRVPPPAARTDDAGRPRVDISNHHNALACPYCNPKGLVTPAEVAALVAERAALVAERAAWQQGVPQWQPIETAPKEEDVWFWCVPKTAAEAFVDTSGHPIVGTHQPYLHRGKWNTWSSLTKATHWMPLPAPPDDKWSAR